MENSVIIKARVSARKRFTGIDERWILRRIKNNPKVGFISKKKNVNKTGYAKTNPRVFRKNY